MLKLGNSINLNKDWIGKASGFRLSSFIKLSEMKAREADDDRPLDHSDQLMRPATMMEYFVKCVEVQLPHLLNFREVHRYLENVSGIKLKKMKKKFSELLSKFKETELMVKDIPTLETDNYHVRCSFNLNSIKEDMETVSTLLIKTEDRYRALAIYYGEDPNVIDTEQFFSIFRTFVQNVQFCQKKNVLLKIVQTSKKGTVPFETVVSAFQQIPNDQTSVDVYFDCIS